MLLKLSGLIYELIEHYKKLIEIWERVIKKNYHEDIKIYEDRITEYKIFISQLKGLAELIKDIKTRIWREKKTTKMIKKILEDEEINVLAKHSKIKSLFFNKFDNWYSDYGGANTPFDAFAEKVFENFGFNENMWKLLEIENDMREIGKIEEHQDNFDWFCVFRKALKKICFSPKTPNKMVGEK